jgi:hypothetical protein
MARTSSREKLQLHRVPSSSTPSVKAAITELQTNLSDISYWIGNAQRDERTLLAEWDGQHISGRKLDSAYGHKVSPWDGSADTVVRLADSASDELIMIMISSFMTANPSAIQQNVADGKVHNAGKVGTLLKYEIRQRMRDELWREMNFFANWGVDYGRSVMQVGWKREYITGKGTISVEELAEWVSSLQTQGQGQDSETQSPMIIEQATQEIQMLIADPAMMVELVKLMQMKYPLLSPKRASKVARDLAKQNGGEVTFRLPIEKPGRPMVKAYCPGISFFSPWRSDEVGNAPWKCVVEQLTEPQVWAKINTDGWDEDFCEKLISQGPKKVVDQASTDPLGTPFSVGRPLFFNTPNDASNRRNMEMHGYYEVVHMWIETVDEDHFPALFEVIFHPAMGDKKGEPLCAINRIVDDFAEGGQFVEFRREYKSRSPWDSRGVPRLVSLSQMERKWMRDGRLNRADMATNPPIRTSRKNAYGKPERLGMAPGRVMQEERGQESSFVPPPQFDEGSVEEEAMIMADVANLLGLFNKDVLPAKTAMHQQYLIWNWLSSCRAIAVKIIEFDQQYMDPINVSNVIGNGPMPFTADRDSIAGQFDVQFEFDVRMGDPEYIKSIWEVVTQAIQNDRQGELNTSVLNRWLIQSVSPTLADIACGDPQQNAQKEADDERAAIGAACLGLIQTPKPGGNAQLRLDTLHQEANTNPIVQQAVQTNPRTQEILEAREKVWMLALQQQQNAGIGATGWKPPEFANEGPQASPGTDQPAPVPQP